MNLILYFYFYFYLCFSTENEKHESTNIQINSCQDDIEDDNNKLDSMSGLKRKRDSL